ncbi:MAG: ABC transporter ATP-binding protein [Lachnospiraceae bacterium]|nr:ABC transporter ATP-binding protein [Lachnospiraceae bacterium]MCR4803977.1 ABC transporter ATP-binding protein/permease [Lachnospiraceae bacterium]
MSQMNEIKKMMKNKDESKKYMRWLAKYTKPFLPSLIILTIVGMLCEVLATQLNIIGKQIIDKAGNGQSIVMLIVLFISIMLGNTVINIGVSLVSVVLGERFAFGIRRNVYDKILRSKWDAITKYHTGDLNTRLTSDADAIATGISGTIPSIIQLCFSLLYNFYILYRYDHFLAYVSLLIAPIAALASFILGRKLKKLQVKVQESEARYRSFFQESLSNILIIKAFGNEADSSEKLNYYRKDRLYWFLKKSRMSLAASSAINLCFQLGYIVAFSWGATQMYKGEITYGTLSLFLAMASRVQSPLLGLSQTIPKLVSILASAGRVIELQNLPDESYPGSELIKKDETTGEIVKHSDEIGVEVEHLSFSYNEDTIFEDTSLKINPGDFVAIVGESGIGKTTLIRLMMSFLSSNNGDINFFNQFGSEASTASSRHFISYVPQGNTLFSGTIASNVRMGRSDATDEEVIAALKASSAYEFVQKLPHGIETVIGERGHGISEGQAQRVALARALIRNAPFLVLDEATASLDEKTELKVLEGIRSLTPKPTCILITHRRSVLDYCDREIKIENKKIHDISLGDM